MKKHPEFDITGGNIGSPRGYSVEEIQNEIDELKDENLKICDYATKKMNENAKLREALREMKAKQRD